MKNYYRVLGVSEEATERELKVAYRQLAWQLHPDRNPDPAAQAHFLEVQEAYGVLGDPHRRLAYELLRHRARQLATPPRSPSIYDPPAAPLSEIRRRPSRRDLLASQMRAWLPYARRFNWLMLAFCSSLLLDWAAPLRTYPLEAVTSKRVVSVSVSRSDPRIAYLITTPNTHFRLRDHLGGILHVGQRVTVRRTPIWRVVRQIQLPYQRALRPYDGGVYGALAVWPALLFVVAAAGLLPRASLETRINTAVAAGLLLLIVSFMVAQSG